MALFTDDFVGAADTLLTTTTGWTATSGYNNVLKLSGSGALNKGAHDGDPVSAMNPVGSASHRVKATVGNGFATSDGQVYIAVAVSSRNGWVGVKYASSIPRLEVWSNRGDVGGGFGIISGLSGQTIAAGDTLELKFDASTRVLIVLKNDVEIFNEDISSGSFGLTGQNVGVMLDYNAAVANNDLLRYWESDTLSAPVAPTLTSPTASATSPTTSTGSVSTDQADGTLYCLTNTSSTATATAVKAASSQAVTASGTQSTSSTSLTENTTYYTHYLHRNAAGLDSAVVTSASFTTPAPAVPPIMNGSITVGTKTSGSISISYPAASDPVGVTGYEVSKDGTTWLDNGTSLSYTFLGLVPLTSYTLSVRAYNAAGLRASPALSVTTSTYREGATGQYIKDNTGPQDGNPEGILYDDVDLPGDANKWFSYRVTTPPVDPDAITLNPDGSFIFTGLVADSFYYQLEVDGEDVGVPQPVTLTTDDPTPPVLSDPTGVATSPTTASGTVVTNESGGTLYFVTTQNATESGTTVKAGASQAVTASGLQSVSSSSLSGATTYYNHYLHRGATGNDSLVVSSAAFTTPAVPPDPPVLSSPTATTTSATTASGTVSTTSSTGTLFILVSTDNTITDAAFWASTSKQSQPVTATGVQTVPLTALSPSTTYTAYYGQIDSLSNQSNVVKSAQFTTDAAPPSTGSKQLNISLRIGFGL